MLQRQTVPIKTVYAGMFDGPHATPKPSESGPIFLGISNVGESGELDFSDVRHISEEEYPRWIKRVEPRHGDIVFSYEATLNRYAIIPKGFRGCLGRRMALIRPDESKACGKFLYYYFFSQEWRSVITQNTLIGSTVDRIPIAKFPEFPISIPSLPAQRKIASILSAYDDLIENNLRRIKILEEMAKTIYDEWFVKFRFPGHEKVKMVESELGLIPEGWEVRGFTDIADVLSGGTPKTSISEYWDGDIPFFAPVDAPSHFYATHTQKAITQAGLKKCNSSLYPKDTVFITARGTVGKVVLTGKDMAMNQSCYALAGKGAVSQPFLFFHTLQSVNQLRKRTGGATFETIIVDTFRRLKVIVPPPGPIKQYTEMIEPLLDLMLNLTLRNELLHQTRDLLLPKLISGEIDVEKYDILLDHEHNE